MSKFPSLELRYVAHPSPPSSSKASRPSVTAKRKLVLIQDPPFQHLRQGGDRDMDKEKESLLFEYMASFGCPVILILSGISGHGDIHYAAEKIVPQSIRSRSFPL